MTSTLGNALKRRATAWASQLTILAKFYAPEHLKAHIHSKVESKDEGTYIIRTTVDRSANSLEKYGTADARAQEYGSGLRARRGTKKKYTIRPKNGKVLAFHWEVAEANPERFSFAKDGRVLLPSVQHPGIQAANEGKGYIGPAQTEIRKRGKVELSVDVKNAILSDLRTSFGRKGK